MIVQGAEELRVLLRPRRIDERPWEVDGRVEEGVGPEASVDGLVVRTAMRGMKPWPKSRSMDLLLQPRSGDVVVVDLTGDSASPATTDSLWSGAAPGGIPSSAWSAAGPSLNPRSGGPEPELALASGGRRGSIP